MNKTAVKSRLSLIGISLLSLNLNAQEAETTYEQEETVIVGISEAQILREQAYAVEAVEMEPFKNQSTNLNDILSMTAGINIRESGGLGSDFTMSVNGLTGNQIRTFIDGVPMDYFGRSLTLNNFTPNLVDRIEVYKGVTPIHLASDALGGSVNVVTRQDADSFLDASYSTGSYGAKIASINSQYRDEDSGFTTRLMSFYNYSDNDYKEQVQLTTFNEFGIGVKDDFYTEVKHFHDAYESRMAWLQTGFTYTEFADSLLVGVMYSDNYDEVQQLPFAPPQAIPWGDVVLEEEKVITNFSYRKNGLLSDKFNLETYLVVVDGENRAIDTSDYSYDWQGNRRLRDDTTRGEIEQRKTDFVLDVDNILGRVNAEYELDSSNNIAINYSFNNLTVQGSDRFKQQNETQFQEPSKVKKNVWALAYTNASLNDSLKNTLFAKSYNYNISTSTTNYSGTTQSFSETDKSFTGYGVASTLFLDDSDLQLKASYERAIRFPEFIELFGDGLNIVANSELEPEETDNYNLGFIYSPYLFDKPLKLSVNVFLRDAKNFIVPYTEGLKTTHQNYVSVTAKGIDLSSNYELNDQWSLALNSSFIDKRDNNVIIDGDKARVPNEPYFFGNISANYKINDLLQDDDTFRATIRQHYVHEYSYRWEDVGQHVVPEQTTTDLTLAYSHRGDSLNYSLDIVNLFDAEVYDNYQQLKPGRTAFIKFRYFYE